MEQRTLLLLEFEGGGDLGRTLNRMLKSCPDSDFSLVCHTCRGFSDIDDDLTQIIRRENPLLILLALPLTIPRPTSRFTQRRVRIDHTRPLTV